MQKLHQHLSVTIPVLSVLCSQVLSPKANELWNEVLSRTRKGRVCLALDVAFPCVQILESPVCSSGAGLRAGPVDWLLGLGHSLTKVFGLLLRCGYLSRPGSPCF